MLAAASRPQLDGQLSPGHTQRQDHAPSPRSFDRSARRTTSSSLTPSRSGGPSIVREKPRPQDIAVIDLPEDDIEDILECVGMQRSPDARRMAIADELLSTKARKERQKSPSPGLRPNDTPEHSALASLGVSLPHRASSSSSIPIRRQGSDRGIELPRARSFRNSPDENDFSFNTPSRASAVDSVPAKPVDKSPSPRPRELSKSAGATPRRDARLSSAKKPAQSKTPPVSSRTRPSATTPLPSPLQRAPSYTRNRTASSTTMLTSRKGASQLNAPSRPPTTKPPSARPRAHSTSSLNGATPPWISSEPLMYKSEAISIGSAAPGSLAALADVTNEKRGPIGGKTWDDVVLPTVAKKLRQQQAMASTDDAMVPMVEMPRQDDGPPFSNSLVLETQEGATTTHESPTITAPTIIETKAEPIQMTKHDDDSHDAGCCTRCAIM